MTKDLTEGSISKGLLIFAGPVIAGDLLQQFYNITDTLIVGQALGADALAAVGSAYALMTFLTSVFLGLSMGAGAFFSICFGRRDEDALKTSIVQAFLLIMSITALVNILVYLGMDPILHFLSVPVKIYASMRLYLQYIFAGIIATSLYNFLACLLRAVGNSVVPLWFLGISSVLNVILDLLFVMVFHYGIAGAAAATVISQYVAGLGILGYVLMKERQLLPTRRHMHFDADMMKQVWNQSFLTCAQQSCMNFGILLVQRLVDSFGPVTMAAFAAAVKIDTFAYLPVQDFGNAFSTFIAQNYGARKSDRLRKGIRTALIMSSLFSVILSVLVVCNAGMLMRIFIRAKEHAAIASGVRYLRIEGSFYIGIGCLFLLYGLYRAIERPGISLVLTIISLGTRVVLAYALAPMIGEVGIWAAIPIGWFLADAAGLGFYWKCRKDIGI
ncbi:MAG: MATE family efflux transporter [Lachnospiraceae bacterium]|nr:MATE family efflux transporter [Lachnospiraceae bacterium]